MFTHGRALCRSTFGGRSDFPSPSPSAVCKLEKQYRAAATLFFFAGAAQIKPCLRRIAANAIYSINAHTNTIMCTRGLMERDGNRFAATLHTRKRVISILIAKIGRVHFPISCHRKMKFTNVSIAQIFSKHNMIGYF